MLGAGKVFSGAVGSLIDWKAGMPTYWTLGESLADDGDGGVDSHAAALGAAGANQREQELSLGTIEAAPLEVVAARLEVRFRG